MAVTLIKVIAKAGYTIELEDENSDGSSEQAHYKKLLIKVIVGIVFGAVLLVIEWTNKLPPLNQLSGRIIWLAIDIAVLMAMWVLRLVPVRILPLKVRI